MRDFLLLGAVAAAFAFGYFVVKRLGCFLDEQQQRLQSSSGRDSLRIGFSDPMIAASLSADLERYSSAYPDTSVSLLGGTEKEVLRAFSAHKLDVVFFPENAVLPETAHAVVRIISLRPAPLIVKQNGLPLAPITEGETRQKIVWLETGLTPAVSSFVEQLQRQCGKHRN